MNISDIRDLSQEELSAKLADLQKESFNLKFQLTIGDIENPMRIREVRKTIAKVKTVMRQKELGQGE